MRYILLLTRSSRYWDCLNQSFDWDCCGVFKKSVRSSTWNCCCNCNNWEISLFSYVPIPKISSIIFMSVASRNCLTNVLFCRLFFNKVFLTRSVWLVSMFDSSFCLGTLYNFGALCFLPPPFEDEVGRTPKPLHNRFIKFHFLFIIFFFMFFFMFFCILLYPVLILDKRVFFDVSSFFFSLFMSLLTASKASAALCLFRFKIWSSGVMKLISGWMDTLEEAGESAMLWKMGFFFSHLLICRASSSRFKTLVLSLLESWPYFLSTYCTIYWMRINKLPVANVFQSLNCVRSKVKLVLG